MKCPKCGYLGFERVERCRNCGYDFSLTSTVTVPDLTLRSGDRELAPLDDLSLVEVHDAAEVVRATATDETNIIFGATVDSRLTGQVWVTVVATGLAGSRRRAAAPSFSSSAGEGRGSDADSAELPSFLRSG